MRLTGLEVIWKNLSFRLKTTNYQLNKKSVKMADPGRDAVNNTEFEFYRAKDSCIYGTSCRKIHNMSLCHNTNADVINTIKLIIIKFNQ